VAPCVPPLAVCATCQQSRRERRRLRKLQSITAEASPATHELSHDPSRDTPASRHQCLSAPAAAQNYRGPHGWTALANGGECIRRDDVLGTAVPPPPPLTGRGTPDDRLMER